MDAILLSFNEFIQEPIAGLGWVGLFMVLLINIVGLFIQKAKTDSEKEETRQAELGGMQTSQTLAHNSFQTLATMWQQQTEVQNRHVGAMLRAISDFNEALKIQLPALTLKVDGIEEKLIEHSKSTKVIETHLNSMLSTTKHILKEIYLIQDALEIKEKCDAKRQEDRDGETTVVASITNGKVDTTREAAG